MDDAGAGLEGVAGDGDGGRPAANDAVSLEDSDFQGIWIGGIGFQEMGEGRTCDSAADNANSMGGGRRRCIRRWCCRRREEDEEEREEKREGSTSRFLFHGD